MSVYIDNGYEDRRDYLKQQADWYGIELNTVFELAAILGPNEDFDGLVTSLEDMHQGY